MAARPGGHSNQQCPVGVLLPLLWTHYEHEPGLASLPMVTRTASGIPGDALNVGLVGSKENVLSAMHAAGWFPADPITLRTSIEIIGSVALDRPYNDAPVSPLLLFSHPPEPLSWQTVLRVNSTPKNSSQQSITTTIALLLREPFR
jgi:hypothetical protein